MKEMLEAAKKYEETLRTVCEDYEAGLEKESTENERISTREERTQLFSGMHIVQQLNLSMIRKLEDIWKTWDPRTSQLGGAMLELAPYYQMYNQYALYFERASKLLNGLLKTRDVFADAVDRCNNKIDEKFADGIDRSLLTLLSIPIRRVSQMLLLMKEVAKRTPPSHDDYGPMQNALKVWQKLLTIVDSSVRKHAKQGTFIDIQSRIQPRRVLLTRGSQRVYYFHGRVRTHIPEGDKKRWLVGILLSDVFLLASSPGLNPISGEMTDARAPLRIVSETEIRRFKKTSLNVDIPRKEMKRTKDLTLQIYGNPRSYSLCVKSWRDKRRWLRAFKEARSKPSHLFRLPFAPVWLPDSAPGARSCGVCGRKIGTLFTQRHQYVHKSGLALFMSLATLHFICSFYIHSLELIFLVSFRSVVASAATYVARNARSTGSPYTVSLATNDKDFGSVTRVSKIVNFMESCQLWRSSVTALGQDVGEGLFGGENMQLCKKAHAEMEAKELHRKGLISKAELDTVEWGEGGVKWRQQWIDLKRMVKRRRPDADLLRKLQNLRAFDSERFGTSFAQVSTLTLGRDAKGRLGLEFTEKELVITYASEHAQKYGAKKNQQILEAQGRHVKNAAELCKILARASKRDALVRLLVEESYDESVEGAGRKTQVPFVSDSKNQTHRRSGAVRMTGLSSLSSSQVRADSSEKAPQDTDSGGDESTRSDNEDDDEDEDLLISSSEDEDDGDGD
eukprot:g1617.t1